MSRPPRIEVANGIYHVVARGNERRLIFVDDIDRERFLELLGGVAERYRWLVLSYCLMGNHYHVLVQRSARTSREECGSSTACTPSGSTVAM